MNLILVPGHGTRGVLGSVHVKRSSSQCSLIAKLIIDFHRGELSECLVGTVVVV